MSVTALTLLADDALELFRQFEQNGELNACHVVSHHRLLVCSGVIDRVDTERHAAFGIDGGNDRRSLRILLVHIKETYFGKHTYIIAYLCLGNLCTCAGIKFAETITQFQCTIYLRVERHTLLRRKNILTIVKIVG